MGTVAMPHAAIAESSFLKTTVTLSKELDRNLEVFCALKGISKNTGMVMLMSGKLKDLGFQPDRMPEKTVVRYSRKRATKEPYRS